MGKETRKLEPMWFRFKVMTLVANKCPKKKDTKQGFFLSGDKQTSWMLKSGRAPPLSSLPQPFAQPGGPFPAGATVLCLSWLCCLWPALCGWLPNSQPSHSWQLSRQALRKAKGWASHGDYGKLLQLGGPWHPSLELELHPCTEYVQDCSLCSPASPVCPELWGLCLPVQPCDYCRRSWGCFAFPTTKGTSRHKGKKLWAICFTQPTVKDKQLIRTADTASLLSSLGALLDPRAGPHSQLPLNIWEGHQLTFCLCLFPLVNNRLSRVKLSS